MSPTPEQQSFIDAQGPQILAIAGPGSGKTQSMAWRIAHDIRTGLVRPELAVVITFTNQAANELRNRITGLVERPPGFIGTLHSWCLAICRRGQDSRLTVLDEQDSTAILQTIAETMRYRGSLTQLRQAVARGQAADDGLGNIVLKQYRMHLIKHRATDLDLILARAAALLKTLPPSAQLDALYVDEYQDSSLADEKVYEATPAKTKVFVGDPDQAVYEWRGGTVGNFMSRFFQLRDTGQVIKMQSNFRSGQAICDRAQELISHAKERIKKSTISRTEHSGEVLRMASASDAAEIIRIISVLKGFSKTEGWGWEEMAVLTRYNYQAHDIARQLPPNDVPAARKKIDDIPPDWSITKALLGLCVDPSNGLAQAILQRHRAGTQDAKKAIAKSLYLVDAPTPAFEAPTSLPTLAGFLFTQGVSKEAQERVLEAARGQETYDLAGLLVTLHRDQERRHEVGHGVTVTTMHSAKGREWKLVIAAGFEDEIIPGKTDRQEEERRLAYVAATRASHVLILSWAGTRKDPYRPDYIKTTPSRFLAEMGLEIVAEKDCQNDT